MKLSNLITLKYGKSQKKVESQSGYPIYGTGGIMGYANTYLYNKETILFGRKGSISNVQFIKEPFWCVDTTFFSIINEDIVIPKYLYYKLSTIDFNIYNEGTTIPSLRVDTLNEIDIEIHDKSTQQHIVNIIGSIDDLIESNFSLINKIDNYFKIIYDKIQNQNFMTFKLKELCEIKYGKSIEVNKLTNNCAYKVYGGNGIIGTLETFEHKSYKIAISCRGAASGNVIITEPYSTISSNSLYLNLFDDSNFFNIYLFLKNANLNNISTGSAQPQITIANIQDFSINIYSHSYNDLLKKLLNEKTVYLKKNEELTKLKQIYLKKFFG